MTRLNSVILTLLSPINEGEKVKLRQIGWINPLKNIPFGEASRIILKINK